MMSRVPMGERWWLRLFSMVLVLYSSQTSAASWQQSLSARVSTEYDSNPAMMQASRMDIWRSLFEPGYKLHGADGVNDWDAGLSVQVTRASNKTLSPNREDSRGFLGWQRHSDTGTFGISGLYNEVATRTTAIDNTGPGFADSTRASRTLSSNWSQALTARTNFGLDGSYERVSYKGGTFIDYVARSGGMKLDYAWSEYSSPFFRISYADYKPTNSNQLSRLTNALLGWSWRFSDYLEGSLQAGRSKVDDAKMGTQGAAAVQYSGQRLGVAVNASRQVTASGLGGFITVDQAKGSWSYIWDERSKTGIDLEWQKNHFFTTITNTVAGAWLQYDTNQFWRTRMYYSHRITTDGIGRAYSNTLGLAVIYTPSDF